MESPRCDKQDMVCSDRAIFGGYGGAFDQRQQITLHAFARHIGTACISTGADFINFVQKHDAVFLHGFQGGGLDRLIIQQLVSLLPDQQIVTVTHRHAFAGCTAAKGLAQHILQALHLCIHAATHRHLGEGAGSICDIKFDHCIIQLAALQFAAKHFTGLRARILASQGFDHAVFCGGFGLCLDVVTHAGAGIVHCSINQIADDAIDITANVADFGEFGGLDL